jgi:hypothetical protein
MHMRTRAHGNHTSLARGMRTWHAMHGGRTDARIHHGGGPAGVLRPQVAYCSNCTGVMRGGRCGACEHIAAEDGALMAGANVTATTAPPAPQQVRPVLAVQQGHHHGHGRQQKPEQGQLGHGRQQTPNQGQLGHGRQQKPEQGHNHGHGRQQEEQEESTANAACLANLPNVHLLCLA